MRKIVRFTGVCCANCAAKLERALEKIDGINSVQLNFMAQRVNFDIDDNKYDEVINKIKEVTNKVLPECQYKGI
jgi:copper chaperone CopZ